MKKIVMLGFFCLFGLSVQAGVLNSVDFSNNVLVLQHRNCQMGKPIEEATKLILPLSHCSATASQLYPVHTQLQRVHWAQHDTDSVWVVLTFAAPYRYQVNSSLPQRHQICLPRCDSLTATKFNPQHFPSNTLFLVQDKPFIIPIANMSIQTFLHRSIGHIPVALVRDGLPHFGAKRGDWLNKLRSHRGYDIYGKPMTILAAAEGKVIRVRRNKMAGQYVKIDHGQGLFTVYVHLTNVQVKQGQRVKQGEVIAQINGAAGNAIAAQLHFELKINNVSVDPLPFIEQFYAGNADVRRDIQRYKQKIKTWIPKRDAQVKQWLKTH